MDESASHSLRLGGTNASVAARQASARTDVDPGVWSDAEVRWMCFCGRSFIKSSLTFCMWHNVFLRVTVMASIAFNCEHGSETQFVNTGRASYCYGNIPTRRQRPSRVSVCWGSIRYWKCLISWEHASLTRAWIYIITIHVVRRRLCPLGSFQKVRCRRF